LPGLRFSETATIRRKVTILLLGHHHSLKAAPTVFAVSTEPLVEMLVTASRHTTGSAPRLSGNIRVSQWSFLIKKYAQASGFQGSWTAQSPCAGRAVEQRLAGLAFAEIRERGRRRSHSALRTYLDVAYSLNMSRSTHGSTAFS